nr:MAG TPA: hypothetical protein [Bacteriophage sp.]
MLFATSLIRNIVFRFKIQVQIYVFYLNITL